MGRNKIPDEVKKRRGTLQPCRASKNSLPALGDFELKPPAWLSRPEKKAFKVAADILSAWGILTPADEGVLTMYVVSLARWKEAEDHIRAEGMFVSTTIFDKRGNPHLVEADNPWYQKSIDQMRASMKLQQQLGFSPNARAKILSMISKDEEEKDDFSEFEQ